MSYFRLVRAVTEQRGRIADCLFTRYIVVTSQHFEYGKTCLKRNLKGPERFSAEARFPFN
jgi:hypothetical protein